jgi:phage-related minor tail protein
VVEATFAATGASATAGNPYIVGERGPELFIPNTAGTIVPNGSNGAISVTNVFHITGATDSRSQSQIAAAAGQGVQRAMARNT